MATKGNIVNTPMLLPNQPIKAKPSLYVYPSLLNAFHNYRIEETGYGETVWVTEQKLIDQINRVRFATTPEQQAGKDFEDRLEAYCLTGHFPPTNYPDSAIIDRMARILPPNQAWQQYVTFEIEGVNIYGYADVVGAGRCIDIKTTGHYDGPKFFDSHQLFYGLGLRAMGWGVRTMEFLVTDFKEVYHEVYDVLSYDYQPLIEEIRLFKQFVADRRDVITDQKLFTGQRNQAYTK